MTYNLHLYSLDEKKIISLEWIIAREKKKIKNTIRENITSNFFLGFLIHKPLVFKVLIDLQEQ